MQELDLRRLLEAGRRDTVRMYSAAVGANIADGPLGAPTVAQLLMRRPLALHVPMRDQVEQEREVQVCLRRRTASSSRQVVGQTRSVLALRCADSPQRSCSGLGTSDCPTHGARHETVLDRPFPRRVMVV